MTHLKTASKVLLAIFMVIAGTMHFVMPAFYIQIMPPYLPLHRELVYISGACEIVLGILFLVPKTSRLAAWGIFALLIAVFPANIYVFRHSEAVREGRSLLPLPLGEGRGEGKNEGICWPYPLTLTLSQRERGLLG